MTGSPTSPLEWLHDALAELEGRGLRRRLETLDSAQGPEITLAGGERLLNFSSNDYLGLAADPRLAAAAKEALDRHGTGTGASRLIVGEQVEHVALEEAIARWKGTEAALVFNSGYHANTGTLPALVGDGDLVVSDALNHASIIDGVRLSRARVVITPHNELEAVERALSGPARRRMVIVDALYSMDGDFAPLRELREICDRFGAMLYVDEAHSTGVFGPDGAGACAEAGIVADVQMGTLGKALGAFGAYVAGPAVLREWLLNRARSFVFTTALPASICAAAKEAVRIAREEEARRTQVLAMAKRFVDRCRNLDLEVGSQSQIVPVILGEPQVAVRVSDSLRRQGIYVRAIRPPTVPTGTSRLRFAFSAAHSGQQVDRAVDALGSALREERR